MSARLAPELIVADLMESLSFWQGLLGFEFVYGREAEGFAFMSRDGVHFMLEQQDTALRSWATATLERPFGRGINFEITLPAIDPVLDRLQHAGWPLFLALETRTYRVGAGARTVRQFLVQDPDGYLLRFAELIAET